MSPKDGRAGGLVDSGMPSPTSLGGGCDNWQSINVKWFVEFSLNKIYELPSTDDE